MENLRSTATLIAVTVAFSITALVLPGCESEPVRPARKLLVLAVDGMDWKIADRLLDEGKLPHVASIADDGIRADLHSLEPLALLRPQVVWTTVATGKGPRKHGIGTDAVRESGRAPVASTSWTARPVWDILGEKDYTVGIINWGVSWPALAVNGYCVSDRFHLTPEDGFDQVEKLTYPEDIALELAPYRNPVVEVTDDEIAFLLNGDAWRTTEDRPIQGGVLTIKVLYAEDETVKEVSEYLLESREQPDYLAVRLSGLRLCSHRFWGQMDPSSVDLIMSDEFIYVFENALLRYYERIDAILGEILDRVEDDTTVVLCSDHGFRGPYRSPEGMKLGIWMHRPLGMLAARGPVIRSGGESPDASVFDLTPTFLALFGESVGRDMDGYVLIDALEPGFLARWPVTFVDSYETGASDAAGTQATRHDDDQAE